MSLPLAPGVPKIPSQPPADRVRVHRRFDRAARLFGEEALERLRTARIFVFGVGGVGSFAAEALARSGAGHLVLIDFDRVCVTNGNRQLHAVRGTTGKVKVELMAERLRQVHPSMTVETKEMFYSAQTSDELLGGQVDYVVDAIDNLTAKAHLIATCLDARLPIASSMGAAARMDPTQVRVADLSDTERDPFARSLRKVLRKTHGIECRKGSPVGVPSVYSEESPIEPTSPSWDEGGFQCVCPGGDNGLHSCTHRPRIEGSCAFVPGAFGLTLASVVTRAHLKRQRP